MIRLIIQRKERDKISLFKQVKCLRNTFKLSWFNAFKLARKINKDYGLIIQTYRTIERQHKEQLLLMDELQSKLQSCYNTLWRNVDFVQDLDATQFFEYPISVYEKIRGYRIYIANKPGYIDNYLTIYS